jgi:hypothetical protein
MAKLPVIMRSGACKCLQWRVEEIEDLVEYQRARSWRAVSLLMRVLVEDALGKVRDSESERNGGYVVKTHYSDSQVRSKKMFLALFSRRQRSVTWIPFLLERAR